MFDFDVVTGPTQGTQQPAPAVPPVAPVQPVGIPARAPASEAVPRREDRDARHAA